MPRRLDRMTVDRLRRGRRLGAHLLVGREGLRRVPRRLLLPGRRVPPRPDVARLRARPERRDHRRRRPLLRAVRSVPRDRAHAARRDHRTGHGGRDRVRGQRDPRRVDGRDGLVAARPDRGAAGLGPRVAGRAARLLDPDPVDHDARRRVAHRAPDRDAAHARLPHRAVGEAPGVAHRAARRGGVPDPCAARLRGPVLCAHAHPGVRVVGRRSARPRRPRVGGNPLALMGLAGGRRPAVDRVLLPVQPAPLRQSARVGLCVGDAAAVARSAARAGLVLAQPTSR